MINRESKVRIIPFVLIRIWKMIREDKNMIWVKKDFGKNRNFARYCQTLVEMGLIDIVPVHYRTGNKYQSTKKTKGYRLNKNYMWEELK